MLTPDLLNALAGVLDAIANGWTVRDDRNQTDGYKIPWPAEAAMDKAGADVAALLGCGVPWDEVATALRTHATTLTPGLPKGWGAYNKHVSDSLTTHSVYGPTNHSYVMLHVRDDGTVRWDTDGQRYAPPAVYAYLLARAGVVS